MRGRPASMFTWEPTPIWGQTISKAAWRRQRLRPHLAPGSQYYWRIDARGAGGITQGSVWTFTTAGIA